ncbi:hypothetical protein CERSUDRAFT_130190 [Gelatoporia subvermispora B]|uniref:DnaJ homologue subfamily C member 28 conserved domain-containing protein n=1 Tax=Ceriporiopsis subvermispora (strain B) TaxID=914234 RepID=M2QTL2_CERS8|nr:hypothetical protein CERSUDRAFT_130190 [Gelatoporia subvermispora B]
MLVDKYKPLRSGPIRTADEKLKSAPPRVGTPAASSEGDVNINMDAVRARAKEPLLPSIEGHEPWHTTFTVPSHATSSVRYGHIAPSPTPRAAPAPLDEKAKRKAREERRRTEHGGRLLRARESTLDYRLGLKAGSPGTPTEQRVPTPVSLKGWANLVEDKIERARLEGHFKNVKGRGQPIQRTTDEKNPFIAREEFLMNRIVQRQGAAPPWVEIQRELESATSSFREVVKQSWIRRAIRILTMSQPSAQLPKLTLADVTALRDAEWEAREQAYHDSALEELNALVRKYNGLAPYAVRRPYYMRGAELDKAYRDCGEDILRGLAERANARSGVTPGGVVDDLEERGSSAGAPAGDGLGGWSLRDMMRDLFAAFKRTSR